MVVLASQIAMVTASTRTRLLFYFIGVNKFNKTYFFFNVKMDI